jgi:hypothetical protein
VFLCAQGVVYALWFHDADEAKKLSTSLGIVMNSSESAAIGEYKGSDDEDLAIQRPAGLEDILYEEVCKVLPSVEAKAFAESPLVISPDVLMKLASGSAGNASGFLGNESKVERNAKIPSKQVFVKAIQAVLAVSFHTF